MTGRPVRRGAGSATPHRAAKAILRGSGIRQKLTFVCEARLIPPQAERFRIFWDIFRDFLLFLALVTRLSRAAGAAVMHDRCPQSGRMATL